MNLKRIVLAGIVTGILFIILDMVIAIASAPIFAPYAGLPIWKNPPDIMAGTVFDLFNGFILAGVYSVIYSGLPGTGWRKGLNYGIIAGLFRVVMGSFSTIVMYNVPLVVTVTGLVTGCIEIAVLCVALSIIYEKL